MKSLADSDRLILIEAILHDGQGSRAVAQARRMGALGGTVFYAHGTATRKMLAWLALPEVRKEVVLLAAEPALASRLMQHLCDEWQLDRLNHGIVFATQISAVAGAALLTGRFAPGKDEAAHKLEEQTMYQLITIIVESGASETVMAAATEGGARGGTIIHGRGCGVHETTRLFGMEVEPGREILQIVCFREQTEGIVASIRREIKLDEPGNGVLFVQDVLEVHGLGSKLLPENPENKEK